jgi:pantothenate kinase type III
VKLLVIDVGNTSTAVGLWSDGRVSKVSHHDGGLEGLESLEGLEGLGGLDGVAYVSVVPKQDAKWRKSAKSFGLRFHQVS